MPVWRSYPPESFSRRHWYGRAAPLRIAYFGSGPIQDSCTQRRSLFDHPVRAGDKDGGKIAVTTLKTARSGQGSLVNISDWATKATLNSVVPQVIAAS
jgi:hypothetical protein